MIAGVITPSSLSLMQRYYCVQAKTNMCGINFHIKMKKQGLQGAKSAQKAVSTEWYDLTGRRLPAATKGINLRLTRFADGSVKTVKVVK